MVYRQGRRGSTGEGSSGRPADAVACKAPARQFAGDVPIMDEAEASAILQDLREDMGKKESPKDIRGVCPPLFFAGQRAKTTSDDAKVDWNDRSGRRQPNR